MSSIEPTTALVSQSMVYLHPCCLSVSTPDPTRRLGAGYRSRHYTGAAGTERPAALRGRLVMRAGVPVAPGAIGIPAFNWRERLRNRRHGVPCQPLARGRGRYGVLPGAPECGKCSQSQSECQRGSSDSPVLHSYLPLACHPTVLHQHQSQVLIDVHCTDLAAR